jgi:hypothetical protein
MKKKTGGGGGLNLNIEVVYLTNLLWFLKQIVIKKSYQNNKWLS